MKAYHLNLLAQAKVIIELLVEESYQDTLREALRHADGDAVDRLLNGKLDCDLDEILDEITAEIHSHAGTGVGCDACNFEPDDPEEMLDTSPGSTCRMCGKGRMYPVACFHKDVR